MPAPVPVIDLTPWFEGGPEDRAGVARNVGPAGDCDRQRGLRFEPIFEDR